MSLDDPCLKKEGKNKKFSGKRTLVMTQKLLDSTASSSPQREVHCADARVWLDAHPLPEHASVITSLPDWSEFQGKWTLSEWKQWFEDSVAQVLRVTPANGIAVFFQTDIKVEGEWVDKAYLCQKAAEKQGTTLLWHSVVCKVAPGNASFGRPGYSHLLAFSKSVRAEIAKSLPDVLPQTGEVTWARGMGVEAVKHACKWIRAHTQSSLIVDPYCGHGTVLAVANAEGFDALGVELGGSRASKAERLCLSADGKLELTELRY